MPRKKQARLPSGINLSPDLRERMIREAKALRAKGAGYRTIASALGVSQLSVRGFLDDTFWSRFNERKRANAAKAAKAKKTKRKKQ